MKLVIADTSTSGVTSYLLAEPVLVRPYLGRNRFNTNWLTVTVRENREIEVRAQRADGRMVALADSQDMEILEALSVPFTNVDGKLYSPESLPSPGETA